MKIPTPTACRWIFTTTWVLSASLAFPAWAAAPFTVNGNGTVSDSSTGLVWDQCPYGLSGSTCTTVTTGTTLLATWPQALAAAVAANASGYKGFTDWRVPNVAELESIAKIDSYTPGVPAIDTGAFPGTPVSRFWTSTTYAPLPSDAWVVNFGNGNTLADRKTESVYVRLVRSGQSLASFDSLSPPSNGVTSIPTLSEWALIMLSGLMLLFGLGQVRRRGN